MSGKGKKGKVFVFSAPSGTGKTTLARKVMEKIKNLQFSVSHTTRAPRQGEVDGRDYFFINTDSFREMIKENKFLEWAKVFNDYYGTSKASVQTVLDTGSDIILDIDEQGALQVKDILGGSAVLIMIIPPSIDALRTRLTGRDKADSNRTLPRIKQADSVLEKFKFYDYIVVNDDFDSAVASLQSIINASRCERARMEEEVGKLIVQLRDRHSVEGKNSG